MKWLLLVTASTVLAGCFSAYNHTGINARPPAPCVCKCEVTPVPQTGEPKK